MKILVTGANGMLGSSLCRLYHNKHKVYALHRDKECFSECLADYSLNLMDLTQLQEIFSQIKPDLVIHCAGFTNVDECERNPNIAYEMNVKVTENITQICSYGTKLVYISTDQVYGETNDHSETNSDLKWVNKYGETKYLGEQKVQEFFPNHIIIRTNIFGWNVKPGKVSSAEWIYHSLKNGKKISLFNDYIFSPIYTVYLGEIIMQMISMDFIGVINVGSPTHCSKYDFGHRLAETFGFNQALINKGSMKQHSFSAKRCEKLDLNCGCLIAMNMDVPEWWQSILMFAKELKNFELQ